jgi:hypothetical protein
MSITVVWDDEAKTAIRHIYQGRWDWSDFYKALQEANAMMDTVNYKVGLIIDVQASGLIPSGAISRIGSLRGRAHRNSGMAALVGANMFVRMLYDIFQKAYRGMDANFVMVSSLNEAREVLARWRESPTFTK